MNITVNIQAPELAKAILTLAEALKGNSAATLTLDGRAVGQAIQPKQEDVPQVPAQSAVVPTASQPVQQAPTQPVQQAPVQKEQPQSVPTQATSYSMDQLAVAATQLVDAGKREALVQLLATFGAPNLMQLPKEQYGAFATKLREMGANI